MYLLLIYTADQHRAWVQDITSLQLDSRDAKRGTTFLLPDFGRFGFYTLRYKLVNSISFISSICKWKQERFQVNVPFHLGNAWVLFWFQVKPLEDFQSQLNIQVQWVKNLVFFMWQNITIGEIISLTTFTSREKKNTPAFKISLISVT